MKNNKHNPTLKDAIVWLHFIAKYNGLKLHRAKDYSIAVDIFNAQQN